MTIRAVYQYPRPVPGAKSGLAHGQPAARTVSPLAGANAKPRGRPPMRALDVSYLGEAGEICMSTHLAPAIPLFDAPFMAFARGTVIATRDGPVAIEDITPGMTVIVHDDAEEPVLWTGSTTLVPGTDGQSHAAGQLTRIPGDAMGLQRPSHDLLLGCGARVLRRRAEAMVPACDLVDEGAAITVRPPSPVRVYHLALRRHAAIRASGIEVESFHPGATLRQFRNPGVKALYASLFPHLRHLSDFGPLAFARRDQDMPNAIYA